jgi:hypothetical protein
MQVNNEEQSIKRKFTDVELCVRYILAHFPEARNNDKILMILFWRIFDKITVPREFERAFIKYATTPETITRARRMVQASGDYMPTGEIKEYRESRRKKIREILRGQSTLLPT